jgi:hypothetical protein
MHGCMRGCNLHGLAWVKADEVVHLVVDVAVDALCDVQVLRWVAALQ